jgi:26S proteasome regulatory subunit N7
VAVPDRKCSSSERRGQLIVLESGRGGWSVLELYHLLSELTKIIEMAPYLRYINYEKTSLIESLSEKNKTYIDSIDVKLKEAEENQGESEISELLRSKAMYLCRIGDKVCRLRLGVMSGSADTRQDKGIAALDLALEKTAGLGARIDLVLAMVRMGLFYQDTDLITANITKATE